MNPATEEHLVRFARLLADLGSRHGLSDLHRAGNGHILSDIGAGMTYLDVARFELEAEAVMQAGVSAILSQTEAAARLDLGLLLADQAASSHGPGSGRPRPADTAQGHRRPDLRGPS